MWDIGAFEKKMKTSWAIDLHGGLKELEEGLTQRNKKITILKNMTTF